MVAVDVTDDSYFSPDNAWLLLERVAKRRHISLFLGAGVPYGSGLPSWLDLVRGLNKAAGFTNCELKGLPTEPPRQMSLARERSSHTRAGEDWSNVVRSCLYDTYQTKRTAAEVPPLPPYKLLNTRNEDRKQIVQWFEATNPTLCAVVRLCSNCGDMDVRSAHQPEPHFRILVSAQ